MKEITGATISKLTIFDFIVTGSSTKAGENFHSDISGQTVHIYVRWEEYVGTYHRLLDEAKILNPKRYAKYKSLGEFISDWKEISGEKAGSENRFKNTGVHIVTGAIEPLPSFTSWMALPTNTSYWGIVDEDGYDIWAKGNCGNVILTHMEYIAPAPEKEAEAPPAPIVKTAPRALASNEKITCLGDTVVMGTRTKTGTYAKGNTLWLGDDGTWYQLHGSQPKTELCPSTKTDTIHKVVIIEEIRKKTTCDCDGIHHTFIDGVCCCGVKKMSANYAGTDNSNYYHSSGRSWFGNGFISFSNDRPLLRIFPQQRQQPQFGGISSNGGSTGGGASNGGNSGGGGSNGGSTGGGGSNGGGSVSGVNQRISRR